MKLEGACERLGRNACEKLGNAIAETATAITGSHMGNQAATMGNLTASPADIRSIATITASRVVIMAIETTGNLTASPATITANTNLTTVIPPMAIPQSFPG